MDWIQFVLFSIGTFGLWFWSRSESRADWRHMDAKLEENRKETHLLLKAIHEEMKDFHGRLCAIEESRK